MNKVMRSLLLVIICVAGFYCLPPVVAEASSILPVDWSEVPNMNGGSSISGTNLGKTQPSFESDDNHLYAAYAELKGTRTVIRIKEYQGTKWEPIDGDGLCIFNYNATDPFLIIYHGSLYCAWREQYVSAADSRYGCYMMRYNGGTSWTRVDEGGVSGICYSSSRDAGSIYLSVHGDRLYAAWDEGYDSIPYQIHVKEFSDSTNAWRSVDNGSESGLNQSAAHSATYPSLISYNGSLYAAWEEMNSSGKKQIMVKSCMIDNISGAYSWNSISGGAEAGLNNSPTQAANIPKFFILKGTLYTAWTEAVVVKARSYNAVTGNWSEVEDLTTRSVIAGKYDIVTYNNSLYIVCLKGSPSKTYVSKFDGISKTNLYDGTNNFISSTTIDNNINPPAIEVFKHTLFASWLEGDSASGYTTKSRSVTLPHIVASASGLTEATLKDASISLSVYGTSFLDSSYDISNFTLSNAPSGLSIESVIDVNGGCTVNLSYNGKDFDEDIHNLGITVAGNEISTGEALSDTLTITANKDAELLAITDDGIISGEENGEIITVTLTGGTFADTLNADNWTVANLPTGVTKGAVAKVNETTVHITLSGNSTNYSTNDRKNITVSCTAVEYLDSTGGGTLTSDTGVTIKAKASKVMITRSGLGAIFTSGESVSIPYQSEFPMGSIITFMAVADSGYNFAYWVDVNSNSILSINASYSFIAGTDTNVRAVFRPSVAGSYQVLIIDPLGKLIDCQSVKNGENAVAPANPYIIGYEFIGWDKSLKNITSNTVITAQFTRLPATYHLNVMNGKIEDSGTSSGDFKYDTRISLKADNPPDGQKFAYWSLNGMIISRNPSLLFFTIMEEMTLTAVYEDASASSPEKPLVALFPTSILGIDNQSVLFIASRDNVPSGCTLIECGILLKNGTAGLSDELTLDTAGISIAKMKGAFTNQFFVRKNGLTAGTTYYARAYMIYLNSTTNEIHIVYSSNTESKAIS